MTMSSNILTEQGNITPGDWQRQYGELARFWFNNCMYICVPPVWYIIVMLIRVSPLRPFSTDLPIPIHTVYTAEVFQL